MWQYNHTPPSDELMHYGILGMKWGVRRSEAQLARARKKAAKREPDHEDYTKAHTPKSIRAMSNAELNDRNRRLQAEKQYSQLTKKTSKGKKIVTTITATAGTVVALHGAYKKTAPIVNDVIDKTGNLIVKNLDKGLNIPIN